MFNLEQAIAEWRQRMSAGGVKAPEVLDELESHLRDDIEQQMRSGLSAEEAFEEVVRRIGQARLLNNEFEKLGLGAQSRKRKFLRITCLGSAVFIILVSAWTFLEHDLGPLERTVGFFTVYSMAFYVGALPWLYGRIPIFLKKAIVTAGLAASFWVILQLLAATQVVQFETGIVPSMVWWTLCTAIVLTAFAERVYTSSGTTQSPFLPFPSLSFTQTAQQSLEIARDEAGRFRHDFVGTEHALLGLLKLESGGLANVFHRLGLDCEQVREEIERQIGLGPLPPTHTLPCTPRLRKALELAAEQAEALNHSQPGAAHIFLGLLLERDGVAGRVLRNLGIDFQNARSEILKEIRSGGSDGPQPAAAGS